MSFELIVLCDELERQVQNLRDVSDRARRMSHGKYIHLVHDADRAIDELDRLITWRLRPVLNAQIAARAS